MPSDVPSALAFGDSVMWGQGLLHNQKFATKIAKNVMGLDFPADTAMIAHSGAHLDSSSSGNNVTDIYGEIPSDVPTIYDQIQNYRRDDSRQNYPEVQLVLLNGGINDINPFKLVNGNLGGYNSLQQNIQNIFHDKINGLLDLVRNKFPEALIVVAGYHFVFSSHSYWDTSSLDIDENDAIWETLVSGYDDFVEQTRRGIRQSSYFMGLSAEAYQQAIDEFNRNDLPQNNGAIFIPSLHTPENATFADQSLNWEINTDFDDYLVVLLALITGDWEMVYENVDASLPVDQVKDKRFQRCSIQATSGNVVGNNPKSKAQCTLASVFHPDNRSANRMTKFTDKIVREFQNLPKLSSFVGQSGSLRETTEKLGFTELPFSYRQVFATNLIGSIHLEGIVKAGSTGNFPYNDMYIEFATDQDSTNWYRYSLNGYLPFMSGFRTKDDYVFPVAFGEIFRGPDGDIETVDQIKEPTEIDFYAFPDEPIGLDRVQEIYLGCESNSDQGKIKLGNLKIDINGRNVYKAKPGIYTDIESKNGRVKLNLD